MTKKYYRMVYAYSRDDEMLVSIGLQFTNREKKWVLQNEFYVTDDLSKVPVQLVFAIASLRELDYEQTYTIRCYKDELWNDDKFN